MKSQLKFKNFVVPKVEFEKLDIDQDESEFIFVPKAVLNRATNQFHINIDVDITDIDNKFLLKILAVGVFEFDNENLDEKVLFNFIGLNGPAIIFPYIRSFVSSFTALSGFDTITLPTMNLSGLKDEIIQGIIETDNSEDVG